MLCLPGGLDRYDLLPLASISLATRRVAARSPVYMAGEAFQHLYAIRSGSCKTAVARSEGREQITGFHLAGDLIGLDGVADGVHQATATALEDTHVCLIPYQRLLTAMGQYPGAKDLLAHVMSYDISRHNSMLALLGPTTAPARLAAFLLDLSERHAARGWSPREFYLHMSRADIASLLGIQFETVSRLLSSFQRDGYIQRRVRRILITDLEGLQSAYRLRMRPLHTTSSSHLSPDLGGVMRRESGLWRR